MNSNLMPSLKIKGRGELYPVVQGGMGVGVSLSELAGAVSREGGVGVISSACIDRIVSKRLGKKVSQYEACVIEIEEAKQKGPQGGVGINIMVALQRDYEASVRAAIDAKADFIISGAGLPLNLPAIQKPADTALIPIVSSARALEIIFKKWERLGYRPDAVVLEGPLAGGHLGFKLNQINDAQQTLEALFPPVKEFAQKHGDIPVIVAGGVYTHEDIALWLARGAAGVQMGTRFLATDESGADSAYKQAVVDCQPNDIQIADGDINPPGSPCGLPFRVLKASPMFRLSHTRKPNCNKGYVLQKDKEGKFTVCPAKEDCTKYFCICNGLLASAGCEEKELPLWTVGQTANRVDKIVAVRELMDELKGQGASVKLSATTSNYASKQN